MGMRAYRVGEESRVTTADEVTRDMVMAALSRALEPLGFVHALWEGGAPGYGRLDDWSDLDTYVLVDEGSVDETFAVVEAALRSLSPIALKYEVGKTHYPGIHQAFYRLARASEYLVLDIAVVVKDAPDMFLDEEVHGKAMFLFRKSTFIMPPPLDREDLEARLRARIPRLRQRMDLFHVFVQKEVNRAHLIEAMDLFRAVVLGSLTELLRIRHHPVHHEFQTRYLYDELPPDVIDRLEELYVVRDTADVERKCRDARAWFDELCQEVERIGVDGLMGR